MTSSGRPSRQCVTRTTRASLGASRWSPRSSRFTGAAGRRAKPQDYLPACFAEADYLINFASLKAHTAGGVTLCAKNHFGSLIRWPVQEGHYDIHPHCFAKESGIYRPLVDLTGHSHFGGKTVLYLVDGLFAGVHPRDPAPQRMQQPPFRGQWSLSSPGLARPGSH